MLLLPSMEQLPSTEYIKVILETDTVQNASPSLVSRMVSLSDSLELDSIHSDLSTIVLIVFFYCSTTTKSVLDYMALCF